VVFAYFIVLPAAITFLTNFDDTVYNVQIRASYYLSFTSLVLIACGLAFEMPIFILALVRIRVLTYDKLRHNRRIGYALMVAFAILLPTVDPVSLLFETIPLLILFEISIWLSRIMEKRWGFGRADGNDEGTELDDVTAWDDEEAGVDAQYPEDVDAGGESGAPDESEDATP
jgi:sec-independent protein translocase protein TatC